MGLFSTVIEWNEQGSEELIFWKWEDSEIKRGSRLVIKAGQDAIFLANGKIEGIFKDEGIYDIESEITPFLSTLKGVKFGFRSGMRAEILFVNTKEFTVKWGTFNPVYIKTSQFEGGIPIRAHGTFSCKVSDYIDLIDKVAGINSEFRVDDIRDRVVSELSPLLMKWISAEGKDIFNLQENSEAISKGIREDLDMKMRIDGITITKFNVQSFSYPDNIWEKMNSGK